MFKVDDRIKIMHPTKTDPVGSHPYRITGVDACHYYVVDWYHDLVTHKIRLDAALPWPGVNYDV